MDTTRSYCEIDGCSSVGIHQVYGKITCNMYQCNQKAKELDKMEQITRELKTGEWINARNLTEPQLNELCKWIINTYEHYPVGEFVINPIIFAISNNELKLFKQDSLRDPSKELTWAQLTERHDQQVDSAEGYTADDQPYIPDVGDYVYLDEGFDFVYGKECFGQKLKVTSIFMDNDIKCATVKLNGVNYCFVAAALTVKSERDTLIDQGCQELTAHFIAAISDRDEDIVKAMVDLGWRPTNE